MVNSNVLNSLPNVPQNSGIYAYMIESTSEKRVYEFLFNPEAKAFSLRANYTEGAAALTSLPSQSYQYTTGQTLQLTDLILESWAASKSITPLLDQLKALTKADPAKGKYSPTPVKFIWGQNSFGPAVITSLSWTETAWVGGEPASARVSFTLLEVPPVTQTQTAQAKTEKQAAQPQKLTDREKSDAIAKAKAYIQSNLRKLKTSNAQLFRTGKYKLTCSESGTVSFLDAKGKTLGTVGTYKQGKFTPNPTI